MNPEAQSGIDPLLDLRDPGNRLWSDVIPLIKRVLATGRRVSIDWDTGWLMASGDPGEVSPEARAFIDSYGPYDTPIQTRWSATGYCPDETDYSRR